jgi:hypothetical protein
MTKKDYELIASVFNKVIEYAKNDGSEVDVPLVKTLARLMSAELNNENPRFDREKFLHACGVTA